MRLKVLLTAFILFLFTVTTLHAQDSSIITWSGSAVTTTGGKYDVILKGQIKKGWHLYAKPDAGVGLNGLVVNFKTENITRDSIVFLSTLSQFEDPIFSSTQTIARDAIEIKIPVTIPADPPAAIRLQLLYDVAQQDNFIPEEQQISVSIGGAAVPAEKSYRMLVPSIDLNNPANNTGASNPSSKGLGGIFILGFLGGLVALLTPCVFPMIPLTVSFFTKKSENRKQGIRNAFIYGFFIFLIYVLLSLPFHFIGNVNPEIFNNISTNVYLNVAFFIVFIVFSLSFFGLFEITLPGAVGNTADSKAGVGSIAGIFFMALTLAIVSFSCTGPILGSLLAGSLSSDGGAMQLSSGMAGFGFALALPFALFAMFP
ncbi:MAG: cytochrome C biogenesis protein, partial [Chitinophagaceae bacterium]